jgi:glycerol kinase
LTEEFFMASRYVLAIDQGTTSTRAVVYDEAGHAVGTAAREFAQHYPRPGWVEHDAQEIWQTVATVVPEAIALAGINPQALAGIGITNQRETSLFWERANGQVLGRALVWQDRRTTDYCRQHQADEPWLHEKTGLVLDPYFSATKLRWLLKNQPGLAQRAQSGALAAGTIDTFLIWRLSGGQVHATDVTNASRTLLFNLRTAAWDEELCRYFEIPRALLPEVRPSAADYGVTRGLSFLPDGLRISGVAGDQQAALFGQCGFAAGEAKCTYGTGAFFLLHTGEKPILSTQKLVSTLAATLDKQPLYALEGSIFIAGAAVQWLRDGLKFFESAPDVEALAQKSSADQPVIFVPALVGLGAPHWVPEARGVIFGVTRGTTAADFARAALEGVAFQVADLIDAAGRDATFPLTTLRVDGGMARNAFFLQNQADVLGLPVLQAPNIESTALGAAFLAGLRAGVWRDLDAIRATQKEARMFSPRTTQDVRQQKLEQWRRAVQAVIGFYHRA